MLNKFSFNVFSMIVGQVSTGLGLIVLARRLEPLAFGEFASTFALGMALGAFLDFGGGQYLIRELLQMRSAFPLESWLARRLVVSIAASVAVAAAIAILLPSWSSSSGSITVLLPILQGVTMPLALGLASVAKAVVSPAVGNACIASGNAWFAVTCVLAPTGSLLVLAGVGAVSSWLVTAAMARLVVNGRAAVVRGPYHGNPWRGTWNFGLFAVASSIPLLYVPLLSIVASIEEAALFGAVSRWDRPIILLGAAFAGQMYPSLASAGSDSAARAMLRPVRVVVLLGVLLAALMVAVSGPLTRWILGPAFAGTGDLLAVGTVAAIPLLVGQSLAVLLQARNRDVDVGRLTLSYATGGLLIASALGASQGAMAGPVALLIVNSALTARLYLLTRAL